MGSGCPKTGTIPPLHLFVATIPLLLILFLNWRSQEEAEERKMQFHILCPRSPGDGHQLGGCCCSSTVFVLDWSTKSVSASSFVCVLILPFLLPSSEWDIPQTLPPRDPWPEGQLLFSQSFHYKT